MLEKELQTLHKEKVEGTILRYDVKILPVLYELDRVNASIAYDMERHYTFEDVTQRFNNAWDGLKRLIYEIERRDINSDKETD
jgi:hypothetical protein